MLEGAFCTVVDDVQLFVEPLMSLLELHSRVSEHEWELAHSLFEREGRRVEFLSSRAILRTHFEGLLGEDTTVKYDSIGAPYILDSQYFISISHSNTHVAVAVSLSPCAVDMESPARAVERALVKHSTDDERELCAGSLVDLWCIKEVLYKLGHQREVSLRDDLRVLSRDNDLYLCELRGLVCSVRVLRCEEWVIALTREGAYAAN